MLIRWLDLEALTIAIPGLRWIVDRGDGEALLDPQGRAIHHSLEGLGFSGVRDVRAGRLIELDVADDTSDAALDEMCRKLLANLVIENYRIERVSA